MTFHSKRFRNVMKQADPTVEYEIEEAVKKLKTMANAKFNETVELAIKLDIDPKQADQQLRGSFTLPHGLGKSKKVIAFCAPEQVPDALGAGAVKAGLEDLAAEIEKGYMDFDVVVATPDSRKVMGKLGKILGAKGLMPNPKSGTLGPNIVQLVKEFSAGKVEYRNDATGNIHAPVGKIQFEQDKLVDNIRAFYMHIFERRPSSVRGVYMKSAFICTTMSPSLRLKALAKETK
ncbi:MAG: 50S ribosomal protein L1 [Candidatus Brocadiia bacterium]